MCFRLEGSCNHVSALLYAIIEITKVKKDGLDASTSKACLWKTPRKRRLSPKKSYQLHKRMKQHEAPIHIESQVDIQSFAAKLAVCAPNAGWLINYTASN